MHSSFPNCCCNDISSVIAFLCFMQAFNLINFLGKNHGMYPILPMYNCFLGACAKMQSMIHANLCLELMESQMVGKNEITYTELLKVCKSY